MIECLCRLDSQNVFRLFINIVVRYRDVMRSERYLEIHGTSGSKDIEYMCNLLNLFQCTTPARRTRALGHAGLIQETLRGFILVGVVILR